MNPGFAFGESIRTEKTPRRRHSGGGSLGVRSYLLIFAVIISVSVFSGRLIYLQLFEGNNYREISDSNRIRTKVINAPRGIIFDRNGEPLVYNIPGFRQILKDKTDETKVKTVTLTREQALPLIANGADNIEIDSLREYKFKDAFSHILGYVGQISDDEYKIREKDGYLPTDWVGKTGAEYEFEKTLRGIAGKQLVETNAMGVETRSLGRTEPISGGDVILTLDAGLQKAVFEAASGIKKGAVVVSKPNGEVLAMVSKPDFDPNLFTLSRDYRPSSTSAYLSVNSMLGDSDSQPLLNRAVSGVYPPASTFKMIVAAAGLERGIINSGYRVQDTGILKVGEFSFANWFYTSYGRTDGSVDVVKGLSRSNDIFFYKLAEKIGVDPVSETARLFGIGQKTGINLPGEASGILPSRDWKKSAIGEQWYLGDTYHYGIGQGFLLATPLQVNLYTQVIANGGTLYKPEILRDKKPVVLREKIISNKSLPLLRQGMIDSCKPGGVAYPLFNLKVKNEKLKIDGRNYLKAASVSANLRDANQYREVIIACKTGTAEHGSGKSKPHAWITVFAPAYDPEVVITVLNESAGEGSSEAAPVAKKILEAYFSN